MTEYYMVMDYNTNQVLKPNLSLEKAEQVSEEFEQQGIPTVINKQSHYIEDK